MVDRGRASGRSFDERAIEVSERARQVAGQFADNTASEIGGSLVRVDLQGAIEIGSGSFQIAQFLA
jgi:hypothetical protein